MGRISARCGMGLGLTAEALALRADALRFIDALLADGCDDLVDIFTSCLEKAMAERRVVEAQRKAEAMAEKKAREAAEKEAREAAARERADAIRSALHPGRLRAPRARLLHLHVVATCEVIDRVRTIGVDTTIYCTVKLNISHTGNPIPIHSGSPARTTSRRARPHCAQGPCFLSLENMSGRF